MKLEAALRKTLFAIPSINGAKFLEAMLPTLRIPTDLVVVLDQGSTDHTEQVCKGAGVELIQLGRPHTYTEACNLAARLAEERGADYVYVSNNDIIFLTDVARQLLAEMLSDPKLAICAPSQMIVDRQAKARIMTYRVHWNLSEVTFNHDLTPPSGSTQRYESDFCELTCAIVRLSTIREIGFLDDEFGFYYEDADFGFRARSAGYTAAYLPQAQIEHYPSSTFIRDKDERRTSFLNRNRQLFADKHLGYGVSYLDHKSEAATSWNIINRNLHPTLHRFGMIASNRPELIFSHPGSEPFDYLYTVWETTKLPADWLPHVRRYKRVMVPSRWGQEVINSSGCQADYVPLGINVDVYSPEGPYERHYDEPTFLWFSRNQYRKGLDVMLKAWAQFRKKNAHGRLIILGHMVTGCMGRPGATKRTWRNLLIEEYPEERVSVREQIEPFNDEEIACLYRSVDFVISNARAEGFGFTTAEAMATGCIPIFANYGATAEFSYDDALLLQGAPVKADYSDKGFDDVGDWWEPDPEQLCALMLQACALDATSRRTLVARARQKIVTEFSWRNTAFALHNILAKIQQQQPPKLSGDKRIPSILPWIKRTTDVKVWY